MSEKLQVTKLMSRAFFARPLWLNVFVDLSNLLL
jgi:hypothetical protein